MAEENNQDHPSHSNKIKAAVAEGGEEEGEEEEEEEEEELSLGKALQQCELNQNMIDISISNLEGLRTKCAASNDLTQQEIRMLEVKLVKYISKQLQCKHKVPSSERTSQLESYPRLSDWFRTINLRKEIIQEVPGDLTLDILLNMSDTKVCEAMKRYGANPEECCRLNAALSCLRTVNDSGGELQDDSVLWTSSETRRESNTVLPPELGCSVGSTQPHSPSLVPRLIHPQPRSISVSVIPTSDYTYLPNRSDNLVDPFSQSPRPGRRTSGAQSITCTPPAPATPPSKKKHRFKSPPPPRTPPPPSRKFIHLFPGFSGLTRSKSHESQLGNRIDEVPTIKFGKKNKFILNLNINGSGSSCDDIATRSPLLPCRPFFPQSIGSSHCLPTTPCPSDDHSSPKNTLRVPRGSPQMLQRDFGLSITHRFSTKSWLSQTCQVCQKNMMFGVKCKHCRLKCHNKCTKEAPPCRISLPQISSIRRTESVPSDINNSVDRSAEPQFGTLPKALNKKDHAPPVPLDSSSNPSSTTSSTPSSPAPFQSSNPPSATPPPNPSPKGHRDRFKFPAAYYFHHRQQFIFPDVPSPSLHVTLQSDSAEDTNTAEETEPEAAEDLDAENEDQGLEDEEANKSESEYETDEVDDLPNSRSHMKGPISRKPSQTSVFLQEWDIPFQELEVGELIGKGRWGKVHKGRWHGEVAIRLLEIDGNNQDHLKLFKKEVMTYRQTRHENVVLFMGACMHPPHLAIITSFCKGRTLFSFVRDSKTTLDINKMRQIAQEIIKGMGYLHARGIVHKDLKSKNIFYDNGKVVITDFGLFGISGVVQEDRRENELKLPNGWLCYVAPEIVQEMYSGKDEDKLPFSKAGDVYAFGTIWYELQAKDWPFKNQPVEAIIWQVGSGEGVQNLLAQISLGKEVTEILSACWSYDHNERPTFTQLMVMLEKLPKLNRRLSHPGHFWKSAELSF